MEKVKEYIQRNGTGIIICSIVAVALVILTFNFNIYGEHSLGFPLPNMCFIESGLLAGNWLWVFPLTIINFLCYLILLFFTYKVFLQNKIEKY